MIRAKKSLGQNFLISPRIVDMIVAASDIQPNETVVEVGPGKGALTKALLKAGAHVVAIEKDNRLIPLLEDTFKSELGRGALRLIHGDVLETDIEIPKNYKVVANIPYYITGALIRKFLSYDSKPESMILMVQKEVATRVIARDEKESILSLSIKAYATPELVVNVSRGNFFPIPNVDSAVIKLRDIKNPFASKETEERFFEVVKAGFSSKRKKLISNLEAVGEKTLWQKKFHSLGLTDNARAEDVSLETWISLSS